MRRLASPSRARPGAPRGSHLRRVRAPFLCTRAPSRPVVAGREPDVVTGKGRFEIHPVAGTHGRPRPAGARAPAREPVPLGSGAVLCARGAWGRRADRCALNRLPERSSFPFPRSLAPGPVPCRGGGGVGGRGARAGAPAAGDARPAAGDHPEAGGRHRRGAVQRPPQPQPDPRAGQHARARRHDGRELLQQPAGRQRLRDLAGQRPRCAAPPPACAVGAQPQLVRGPCGARSETPGPGRGLPRE